MHIPLSRDQKNPEGFFLLSNFTEWTNRLLGEQWQGKREFVANLLERISIKLIGIKQPPEKKHMQVWVRK